MNTIITNAVKNFLDTQRYSITFECCGRSAKDDQAIADLIYLKDLTIEDIQEIVNNEYKDALEAIEEASIENIVKYFSVSLCNAWIAKRNDITIGYDYSNRFHEGLRGGETTMWMIA